jgi:hypothetical protein
VRSVLGAAHGPRSAPLHRVLRTGGPRVSRAPPIVRARCPQGAATERRLTRAACDLPQARALESRP